MTGCKNSIPKFSAILISSAQKNIIPMQFVKQIEFIFLRKIRVCAKKHNPKRGNPTNK